MRRADGFCKTWRRCGGAQRGGRTSSHRNPHPPHPPRRRPPAQRTCLKLTFVPGRVALRTGKVDRAPPSAPKWLKRSIHQSGVVPERGLLDTHKIAKSCPPPPPFTHAKTGWGLAREVRLGRALGAIPHPLHSPLEPPPPSTHPSQPRANHHPTPPNP
jgi:hypothetical protein